MTEGSGITPAPAVATAERRPLARAVIILVGLGLVFYTTYPFANWVASQRTNVPSIVFAWEHSIPFLPWTIIPYWTTNLFYAASVPLCRTRRELDSHARRLLTAQLVAVSCFLAFPLKFSWPKPDTSGLFGAFFEALGAFDKPFNQAPSLHVALTVILWAFYAKILPRPWRWLFGGWSILVVGSVLTTFQHHFIDIPTGLLLGLTCIWLFPSTGGTPLRAWGLTRDPRRRRLASFYALAALILAALAALLGGVALWLLWPAFALAAVALAYFALGPALFGKTGDGTMPQAVQWLLGPYLLGAWLNSRLWTRTDAAMVEIVPDLFLGRFPSARDIRPFAAVVDLTAELPRPAYAGAWRNIAMLDLVAPAPSALRTAAEAIEELRSRGPVLVCCALGYGRSAATLATWLVRSGRAADSAAALKLLRAKRPRLHVNAAQRAAIEEALRG